MDRRSVPAGALAVLAAPPTAKVRRAEVNPFLGAAHIRHATQPDASVEAITAFTRKHPAPALRGQETT